MLYPPEDNYPFVRLVSGDIKVHILYIENAEDEKNLDVAVCGSEVDQDAIRRPEWWHPDTCGDCFYRYGRRVKRAQREA